VRHHAEVVGNKNVGQSEFLLKILEQVDDLGLDGHIQSAHGFVRYDQLRPHAQGAGDADALTLAPGELVGIFVQVGRPQADLFQQRPCRFTPRRRAPAAAPPEPAR